MYMESLSIPFNFPVKETTYLDKKAGTLTNLQCSAKLQI